MMINFLYNIKLTNIVNIKERVSSNISIRNVTRGNYVSPMTMDLWYIL